MTFKEVLAQVIAWLQQEHRVSYRALKRQFDLDDAYLEDLKDALLYAHPQVVDDQGRGLLWMGDVEAPVAPPPTAPRVRPDAERRQLTVLFCDLADSTRLASQLDPEDLRAVVRAYQETAAAVIQHYDGHIAQYLGDGLLVYFGYPQAHEDDAQRAVRSGLELLAALRTRNTRLVEEQGVQLAVRIGIHTGLVVVGEMGSGGRHEHLALGDTPNLAARLQGLAAPDTVVISAATARLVQGYFVCQDHGVQMLKGVDTPLRVSQVVGETAAQNRLDVAGTTGLTPLVGRAAEVSLLLERWAQSQGGLGQVVLLSGEAGIGKSRLVRVLTERVVAEGAPRLTLHCSPYHANSAFYPVIDHLQRLLHWHRDVSPQARLTTLEEVVQAAHLPLEETVLLLAALLSVPVPNRYPPLTLSPQRQKQKTQEALVAWLLAETAQQPVLAVWEDLHWADPSTLELLGLLLDQVPTARLLLVLTCRPEFRPSWAPRSYVTPLALTRLVRPQVEEMVLRVTDGKRLPAEVVQQIVVKTDGIPLFVEELVKTILEAGLVREEAGRYVLTGPLPPLAIPTTLQDALMARLDRLASVKEIAQLGAVLGREFAYVLLQAVTPLEDPILQQSLAQLVEAELLYQRGHPPQATYLFKHALVQDAAYQSLLKSTRQQYHQRIAQVLETQFPETAETQPELLAHHYTEAGLPAQSIPYWQWAGNRASQRSAYMEAVAHLTKGLEVLKVLPNTAERTQQELALQTTLGPALMATRGFAAPEVQHAYARAQELCQQAGESPQLFSVLRGLWNFSLVRAELQKARRLGEQLLTLAQRQPAPALLLEAYFVLGLSLFWLGEPVSARARLEQSISLYDPQHHRAHALHYGLEPGVICLSYAAVTLWTLGYPDQALESIGKALLLAAQEPSHPFSLAQSFSWAVRLHWLRRERQAAHERTVALMALASEQEFAYWLAWGTISQGRTLVEQGQAEDGIVRIRQGLAAHRATGGELSRPWFLAMLAEAYGMRGQADEGLCVLAEALTTAYQTGDRYFEAELYRLKGELLLQQTSPDVHQAETCFQQALTIARHQQAKSLELRAAMSLARLWQQQGKRAEAHALLAPVYGWFTEGFDTADLQEAHALLEAVA
jgi:class 3 adenylate cyclase/predicted ATPase